MALNVALLEYFTAPDYCLVFLVKAGQNQPGVFELRLPPPAGRLLTQADLLACVERLMLDFHGLPPGWDTPERLPHFRGLLALPPAVTAAKRSKEILQLNLKKPAFAYSLDYLDNLAPALFPPALRTEIEACDLLCIVPHGPLHALPFAALRWSPQEYLVERFGLCTVPSAAVLRYCQSKNQARREPRPAGPASCLIAAVAAADDQDPLEFEADGASLAEIFAARSRQAQVTRLLGARAADGRRPAAKDLILQTIAGHELVHLACHGLFSDEDAGGDPLDSGLLVSDGETALSLAAASRMSPAERLSHFITAREILGLQLSAGLVTLRACSSGRAEIRSGDELLGLTRALLYAGAPSLIVSLWNVNKLSSRRLLDEFYRLWLSTEDPLPKWQALQQAQISLLRSPQDDYSHPYHWAAFTLVGDWL